ncbi:MAG: MOSC domain-containing protein [Bacteroidia bacterium]
MLKAIYTYPVKSLGGIALKEAQLGPRGIFMDRRWILTDLHGNMLTQRSHPTMALFKTDFASNGILVFPPDAEDEDDHILLPFDMHEDETAKIDVFGTQGKAHALGQAYDLWFSFHLDSPCRIWFMPDDSDRMLESSYTSYQGPMSFADGWPLLVLSEASLVSLNDRMAEPVPMDRFRPNLVVDGDFPFQEDSWKRIQIGDAVIEGGKPCGRCAIVTVDQKTGIKGKEPLETLAGWRRKENSVIFGWNMFSREGGKIAVGDQVVEL